MTTVGMLKVAQCVRTLNTAVSVKYVQVNDGLFPPPFSPRLKCFYWCNVQIVFSSVSMHVLPECKILGPLMPKVTEKLGTMIWVSYCCCKLWYSVSEISSQQEKHLQLRLAAQEQVGCGLVDDFTWIHLQSSCFSLPLKYDVVFARSEVDELDHLRHHYTIAEALVTLSLIASVEVL